MQKHLKQPTRSPTGGDFKQVLDHQNQHSVEETHCDLALLQLIII
jgi:hypothetical protein